MYNNNNNCNSNKVTAQKEKEDKERNLDRRGMKVMGKEVSFKLKLKERNENRESQRGSGSYIILVPPHKVLVFLGLRAGRRYCASGMMKFSPLFIVSEGIKC